MNGDGSFRLHRRRFRRRRRDPRRAARRGRAHACFCWKPAAIRASFRAPMTTSPASTACRTIMTCRAFHGFASENDAMRWDFFVRHYASDELQAEGPEIRRDYRGVPVRRGPLSARRHFGRLHRAQCDDPRLSAQCGLGRDRAADRRCVVECRARCGAISAAGELPSPAARALALAEVGPNPSRHGWRRLAAGRRRRYPPAAVRRFRPGPGTAPFGRRRRSTISGSRSNACIDLVESKADPNDWRLVTENAVGVRYTPLTTRDHARMGTRERVLETAQKISGSAPGRARRAGHPRIARRAQPRDRRRISEG